MWRDWDTALPTEELAQSTPSQENTPQPDAQDPKNALAARMARFKSLQAQKSSGKNANREAARTEVSQSTNLEELAKARKRGEEAEFKLAKLEDEDGRKRAWDYTIEESENWDKRVAKKQRNKDGNAFRNYSAEGNKVYKRQVKQMGKVDLETYQARKAAKIQDQLDRGILVIRENEHGQTVVVDPVTGREDEPVDEGHTLYDHKPDKEDLDRLVADEEKRERTRLEAQKRKKQSDDSGDVTYINEKNKQFNLRLARAYNKYTAETRESFERGTAL